MALATLLACYNNPMVFRGVVKIRKGQAVTLMMGATSMEAVRTIISQYSQEVGSTRVHVVHFLRTPSWLVGAELVLFLSLTPSPCLSFSPPPPPSLLLSHSPCLSFSPPLLFFSLSLSLSLFLSPPFSSLTRSPCLSFSPPHLLFFSLSLFLSLPFFVSLPPCFFVSLSLLPCISHSLSVSLSFLPCISHSLCLSLSPPNSCSRRSRRQTRRAPRRCTSWAWSRSSRRPCSPRWPPRWRTCRPCTCPPPCCWPRSAGSTWAPAPWHRRRAGTWRDASLPLPAHTLSHHLSRT